MGGSIGNCLTCGGFIRIGDKCAACHPEELENAIAAGTAAMTHQKPKYDPVAPNPHRTKPRNKHDQKLLDYLIASVPSTATVAHYLIHQMRYDVFVANVVGNKGSDNGDIHIRKSPD